MHFILTSHSKLNKSKFNEQETDFNKAKSVSFKEKKKSKETNKSPIHGCSLQHPFVFVAGTLPHSFEPRVPFTSRVFSSEVFPPVE